MSAFHAAVAGTLLSLGVGMTTVGRCWPVRAKHRGLRRRPAEELVPAGVLIPAFAGNGWPTAGFAHCVECRRTVPVVIHGQAYRCDAGHTTIHTTTGDHQ